MPALQDPRHERFAQARAKGALLIDAYESAGFVRHRGHPSRLALKDKVAERIAELRASQTDIEDTSPLGLLASLRRIIKAGEASENPTLVNAARLAIVDASRLQAELAR
ncbi:MAG: Terminase small subunit, partial [Caulobacteraceae bacterium]|nr:Terminase small subunit [Caulobacteraceae bacterium]